MTPAHRFALLATAILVSTVPGEARDRIRVQGSDLVLRFVAAAHGDGETSIVPGPADTAFRAFCSGVGDATPDAVGATRPMTDGELKACTGAGVTAITDLTFGRDALVLASAPDGPAFSLTRAAFFSAIAAKVLVDGQLVANPYRRWVDIDPALPDLPIRVLGPQPGSDLAADVARRLVEPGCRSFPALQELPPEAGDICTPLRKDGAYVAATGGTAAALDAAAAEPGTLAITTFGAVTRRTPALAVAALDGVRPDAGTIASGRYKATIDLHLVTKTAHRGLVPAFDVFIRRFVTDAVIGPDGTLAKIGLVPADPQVRGLLRRDVDAHAPARQD